MSASEPPEYHMQGSELGEMPPAPAPACPAGLAPGEPNETAKPASSYLQDLTFPVGEEETSQKEEEAPALQNQLYMAPASDGIDYSAVSLQRPLHGEPAPTRPSEPGKEALQYYSGANGTLSRSIFPSVPTAPVEEYVPAAQKSFKTREEAPLIEL